MLIKKSIFNKAVIVGKHEQITQNNSNREIVNFFTMKLPSYDKGGTFCLVWFRNLNKYLNFLIQIASFLMSAISQQNPWLHRFAVFTALATLFLIGMGGLVTSKGVGMAVPD